MNTEIIKHTIHDLNNKIDDESALQILMEEATQYANKTMSDGGIESLGAQWANIEKAQVQIKNNQYRTYNEVKLHFAE